MNGFNHTTAKIAAWNLAGFLGISNERLERQVEGLALAERQSTWKVAITAW